MATDCNRAEGWHCSLMSGACHPMHCEWESEQGGIRLTEVFWHDADDIFQLYRLDARRRQRLLGCRRRISHVYFWPAPVASYSLAAYPRRSAMSTIRNRRRRAPPIRAALALLPHGRHRPRRALRAGSEAASWLDPDGDNDFRLVGPAAFSYHNEGKAS